MTGGYTVKGRDKTGAVVFEVEMISFGFDEAQLIAIHQEDAEAAGLDPSALVWSLEWAADAV